jgi:hypothetical protein
MQRLDKPTCNIRLKKTDETLGTNTCNMRDHYNVCNIPIYFAKSVWNTYNIPLKHLKILKIYAWNMHYILVQPPLPFALGCRSRSRRRGLRAFAPGSGTSPCAGASVGVVEREHVCSAQLAAEGVVATRGCRVARAVWRGVQRREQRQGQWSRSRSEADTRWWNVAL